MVLCLRGSDPFLQQTLENVLRQDYPRYSVRVVIDSYEDPAWQVVVQVVARSPAITPEVVVLTDRLETCSLKCSALVQVLSDLDESYEILALLDADTLPHPTWLRELATPLADPMIGASTGNRWYMPTMVSRGHVGSSSDGTRLPSCRCIGIEYRGEERWRSRPRPCGKPTLPIVGQRLFAKIR